MIRGLVIGKFLPPHRGHRYLLEVARAQVDELTIVVCEREDQSIPGALRARWLREMVPQAEVRIAPDTVPAEDSEGWAAHTLRILGRAPDVVFTSEDYGEAYARFLGCRHVLVDRERNAVPISGSAVRRDPLAAWEYLDPCVRAHFARRVIVVGAESTGTTTLAIALARHYRTVWVPEFGRLYTEAKLASGELPAWEASEFAFIAAQQNQLEDQLARSCNKILVCDTDAFATRLWQERYVATISAEVEALAATRAPRFYLLTGDDVPFVQDGTRDGQHIRTDMHRRFQEELRDGGHPFRIVVGDHQTRLCTAIEACDRVLAEARPL